jgi:hypothetical protein
MPGFQRDPKRKQAIIDEYNWQIRKYGKPNWGKINQAVGLQSTLGRYAHRVIKKWRKETRAANTGTLRSCLCCDKMFASQGLHNRLCDGCRAGGEYHAPFPISPSIHFTGSGRW